MDIEGHSVAYTKNHICAKLSDIIGAVADFPDVPTPRQRRLLDALATVLTAAAIVAEEMGGEE